MYEYEERSNCCEDPVRLEGNETLFYVCTGCGDVCNIIEEEEDYEEVLDGEDDFMVRDSDFI